MRIHFLQHVPFEGLGCIHQWSQDQGHNLSATALFADNAFLDPTAFDWLIVMGGPMGVCDTETFPWMDQETQFIAQCIRQRKKVLGICLGAQLIDRAHWKDGLLKLSFFGLNGGLLLMAFGTLLPGGHAGLDFL